MKGRGIHVIKIYFSATFSVTKYTKSVILTYWLFIVSLRTMAFKCMWRKLGWHVVCEFEDIWGQRPIQYLYLSVHCLQQTCTFINKKYVYTTTRFYFILYTAVYRHILLLHPFLVKLQKSVNSSINNTLY